MKIPLFTFHKVGPLYSRYWVTRDMLWGLLTAIHTVGYRPITMEQMERGDYGQQPCGLLFDDGYKNFETEAVPLLRKFDMSATVFVPTEFIGQTNAHWEQRDTITLEHLTKDSIWSLSREGFDFQPHGHTHQDLTKLPPEVQASELAVSKRILEDIVERERRVFSYPYGELNDKLKQAVRDAGYGMAVHASHEVVDTATIDRYDVPTTLVLSPRPC